MDLRFKVPVFEALLSIFNDAPKYLGEGETPELVLNKVLQDLVDCKFGVPEEVTSELSQLVQSKDVRNNLVILSRNYKNFKSIWTVKEMKMFTASLKKTLLKQEKQH